MKRTTKLMAVLFAAILAVSILVLSAYAAGSTVTVGVTGYNTGHEVTVSLCQNGEVKHSGFVTLYEGGGKITREVDVANVISGTYDIVIESEGCIITTITDVFVDRAINLTLYDNGSLNNITLINGDIDGNGFIDSTDVSTFVFDMAKSDENASYPNSDINGDTYRDALDVSILSHNLFAQDPKIPFVSELPEYTAFSSDIVENVTTKNGTPVTVTVSANAITVDSTDSHMALSVAAAKMESNLTFTSWNPTVTGYSGSLTDKNGLSLTIAPITANDGTVLNLITHLSWDEEASLLRKYVEYMVQGSDSVHMTQITLDTVDITGDNQLLNVFPDMSNGSNAVNYNSWPAYLTDHFMGIEFPVATTNSDATTLYLRHTPEIDMTANFWYSSKTEICGLADGQDSEDAFWDYMYPRTKVATYPDGYYFNYNSWWSQYEMPYGETMTLDLMQKFFGGISKYGAAVEGYTIDCGWSNKQSIWEIDPIRFPEEFKNIDEYAGQFGTELGFWFSPATSYPDATDTVWAKEAGYNIITGITPNGVCMWDDVFAQEMIENLYHNVHEYGVEVFRGDGLYLTCTATDHGHVGDGSPQATFGTGTIEHAAENYIRILEAAIEANPDIVVNSINTFGTANPSPWWMQWVTATNANMGNDSPKGRIPAPDYRDSYTSARDFFSLQGLCNYDIPAEMQEVFGLLQQTPSDFTDDFVSVLFRGHFFLDLYVNHNFMSEERYERLADMINWAKANEDILLNNTEAIYQESWDLDNAYPLNHSTQLWREPYGFAHGKLVMLRNPWAEKAEITIDVPTAEGEVGSYDVISLYPEVRVYAKNVSAGSSVTIPLSAYETVVLTTDVCGAVDLPVYTVPCAITVSGDNYNFDLADDGVFSADYEATVTVSDEINRLYVLLEATNDPKAPAITIKVDGAPQTVKYTGTATDAWYADGLATPESWLFAYVDLSAGTHSIEIDFSTNEAITEASAFVWSYRTQSTDTVHENMLPAPEEISGDSAMLFSTKLIGIGKFALANCDDTTQIANPALQLSTENKMQGSGALMSVNPQTVETFMVMLGKQTDLSAYEEDGLIHMWVYVSDTSGITDGLGRIEISHDAGVNIDNFSYWDISGLTNGWNEIIMPISAATQNNANWSKINYFRFYQYIAGPVTIGVDDIYIGHPDDMPAMYDITFEGGSATGGSAPASKATTAGNNIAIPQNTFTNYGHTFTGWLCSADGQIYQPGDTYTVSGAATFTAQWIEGSPEAFVKELALCNTASAGITSDTHFFIGGTNVVLPTSESIDGKIGYVMDAKAGINIIQRHPLNMSVWELPADELTLSFDFYVEDASKLTAGTSYFNIISGVNTGILQTYFTSFGTIENGWNSLSIPLSEMNAAVGTLDLLDLQAVSVGLNITADTKLGMANVKLVYGSQGGDQIGGDYILVALDSSKNASDTALINGSDVSWPAVGTFGDKLGFGDVASTSIGSFILQRYPLPESLTLTGKTASEYTFTIDIYIEDITKIDPAASTAKIIIGPSEVDANGGAWHLSLNAFELTNGWNTIEIPLTAETYSGLLDVTELTTLPFSAINITVTPTGETTVAAANARLVY